MADVCWQQAIAFPGQHSRSPSPASRKRYSARPERRTDTKVLWSARQPMIHHRTGGNATTSLAIEETNGMTATALVSIVDDDESVRESLPDLLKEFGFAVQSFASAEEFLASGRVEETRCLVLDIAMPGMSGPELQRELTRRN